jgi:CheY-like chemotaxis protein
MPRIDGGEVARRLQLLRGLGEIMIVATTGTDSQDERLTEYGGVFDAYLPKPYNLARLESLLGAYAADTSGHTRGRR